MIQNTDIINGKATVTITQYETKVVFPDIDNWVAYLTTVINDSPSYYIHDSNDKYRAFIGSAGKLDIVLNPEHIGGRIYKTKSSGKNFNPKTELKQAVRYAYLCTQKLK